jgi:hypothetical protein
MIFKLLNLFLIIIFLPILTIFALLFFLTGVLAGTLEYNEPAKKLLINAESLDQSANAMLGGHMDHTISGRMGYRIKLRKATKIEVWLCKLLSKIDQTSDKHCLDAIEWDEV